MLHGWCLCYAVPASPQMQDGPCTWQPMQVDRPAGEKQRIERSYNFIDVCGWFAARCDLILLLFDPHKLDISDEFKQVLAMWQSYIVLLQLDGHGPLVQGILGPASSRHTQLPSGAWRWCRPLCLPSAEGCPTCVL